MRRINSLRRGTEQALGMILPFPYQMDEMQTIQNLDDQHNISVMIDILGELECRLLLKGNHETFSKMGETLFGMPIDSSMMESFAGEIGNLFGGNFAINIQDLYQIDITPPSVNHPTHTQFDFVEAIHFPIKIDGRVQVSIYYLFQQAMHKIID